MSRGRGLLGTPIPKLWFDSPYQKGLKWPERTWKELKEFERIERIDRSARSGKVWHTEDGVTDKSSTREACTSKKRAFAKLDWRKLLLRHLLYNFFKYMKYYEWLWHHHSSLQDPKHFRLNKTDSGQELQSSC